MISTDTCVATSDGDKLGNLFCIGNSYIVLETHSNDFSGMYNVINQWFSIYGRT